MLHQTSLISNKIDEIQELVSRFLGWSVRLRPSSNHEIRSSIVVRSGYSTVAIRAEYSSGFRAFAPRGPENLSFVLVHRGEVGKYNQTNSDMHGDDRILIANVPDIDSIAVEGHSDTTYFTIDKTILARQAFLMDSIESLPEINGLVALPATEMVGQAIKYKFEFLYHHMGMASQGLISPHSERLLEDAILAGLVNLLGTIGLSRPRQPTGSRLQLRRALDIIHASDTPLTVFDLAEQTGASVRVLQHAFQKYLGTAPIAYMKQIRLDRARADLLVADPDTMHLVMRKWGFSNVTRFRQEYVARFGEGAWPGTRRP